MLLRPGSTFLYTVVRNRLQTLPRCSKPRHSRVAARAFLLGTVSRTGDVVNAILGSVLPSGNIGPTSLKMDRLVLWIVAAVLAYIGHEVLEFDMLSTLLDVGDVDLIWNMLAFMSVVDAVDAFARKKLL